MEDSAKLDQDSQDRDLLCEVVEELAPNFKEIHGRVGSAQSPQVIDPSSQQCHHELDTFERFWGTIWMSQLSLASHKDTAHLARFMFTAEHGPPPYQPV